MRQVLRVDLPNDKGAAAVARTAMQGLVERIPEPILHDLELLVTELVTNSVRHANLPGDAVITARVSVGRDRVRVEVADQGPGFAGMDPSPDEDKTGGWGLLLVDEIADAWGVEIGGDGTTVWFELECELVG